LAQKLDLENLQPKLFNSGDAHQQNMWAVRKMEQSGPKIGWSGRCRKTMEWEWSAEREVAELERGGEWAESAAHSPLPLQPNISLHW